MPTVDVRAFEDTFVIYFGGELRQANAYTLASTLVGLADAAKAANAVINPGYEIEVVVEALGDGSFRTKVRALYRGADNLFTKENLKAVVLAVIAAFVYEHTLAPDRDVTVNVTDQEVVIEQGDTRIVVPREVHDAKREVEDLPGFREGIAGAARAIASDPTIDTFGFTGEHDDVPSVPIPRNELPRIADPIPTDMDDTREIEEITVVRIIRAILERSKRRWEFVWKGVRISAPVLDDSFYDAFFAHRITIAPGDALEARVKIKQRLAPDIGIYINEAYEVVQVLRHIPRSEQDNIRLD